MNVRKPITSVYFKYTKENVVTGMYHPAHYKIQEDRRFR